MDEPLAGMTHGLTCCDEQAWRTFHDGYYEQLRRLALARSTADCDVPEIIQGVYLRVLRHARVFHDEEAFKAWLACLLRCEVIDHVRKKGRRSWLNERFQQWQEARRSTTEPTSHDQLEEALQTLDEHEQALIRQHYLDGWSQEKLAEQHQVSVKAMESKLARLRKRLRQTLQKQATSPS